MHHFRCVRLRALIVLRGLGAMLPLPMLNTDVEGVAPERRQINIKHANNITQSTRFTICDFRQCCLLHVNPITYFGTNLKKHCLAGSYGQLFFKYFPSTP
jgi:hypothetical protein